MNNRFIKSSYLHHAVKKAFDTLIADDYIPFYVIFIEVPLEKVDVNVHPHKTEVRFEEEKLLYLLMTTSLRKALATHHCMHTIDFEGAGTKAIFEGQEETAPMEPIEMPATPIAEVPRIFPMDNHEDSFFIPFNADKKAVERDKQASTTDAFGKGKESFFLANGRDNHVAKTSAIHNLSITFQLHGKYICTQAKSGLLIINQRRAYERILYERNMKLLDLRETQSQKLLFPQKISLQPADMTLLKGCKDTLYQLGFRFVLHDDHIVVTGHPVDALHQRNSNENLLLGLLEQYKMQTDVSFENEKWAISLAKRSNLPEGSTLLPQEINSIIDQLFACKNPTYTLEGKAIWQVIPMEQIDAWIDKG